MLIPKVGHDWVNKVQRSPRTNVQVQWKPQAEGASGGEAVYMCSKHNGHQDPKIKIDPPMLLRRESMMLMHETVVHHVQLRNCVTFEG